MEQAAQLEAIKRYTIQKLGNDSTGHGLDHIMRVVRMTKKLIETEAANEFIAVAAAYLHDTIDEKLVISVKEAEEELEDFLRRIDLTNEQIQAIMDIISNMSFADTLGDARPTLSREGQIVQDADWLDGLGSIGITRAVYYGGSHGERIYDPLIRPREHMNREEYRTERDETVINHFYEKLLKIKDMLNTETARKIAAHRQQIMEVFLNEFFLEWDAKA